MGRLTKFRHELMSRFIKTVMRAWADLPNQERAHRQSYQNRNEVMGRLAKFRHEPMGRFNKTGTSSWALLSKQERGHGQIYPNGGELMGRLNKAGASALIDGQTYQYNSELLV